MERKALNIKGMSCAVCANTIENTVRKLPGVTQADLNFASEKLFVEYDPSVTDTDAIKDAVKQAGYEAEEKPETRTVTIPVGGMTCAACVQRVEKAVRRVEGVESASVNLATEKATVVYRPKEARLSAIRESIEKAGYQALSPQTKNAAEENAARKRREIRNQWLRFALAAAFSLPLLYIAMGPMLGLPLPAALSPEGHPLRYAVAELLLVLPVIAVGYRFYTVGLKALWQRSPT